MCISGACGKAGNGNEMENGNGNGKRKLETEMGTNDAPITGAVFSSQTPSGVLCHYSCILVSNDYMMSHALCFYSCTVLCDYLFSVID